MREYFNIFLEFNHVELKQIIEHTISEKKKGYVCVVDANVLTIAQKNLKYRTVINSALVNTCDGSSIAVLASIVHKSHLQELTGPEIFAYYIERGYSQLLLGSNEETSNLIKQRLVDKGIGTSNVSLLPLPFKAVEEFDYLAIAERINELKPEIIWVSLGAPKQEQFMANILPHINSGVMFGIGAAFNFYIGKIALPSFRIGSLKFIWVSRIFKEPQKQISRIIPYLKILPSLYWLERKKLYAQRNKSL